MLIRRKRKHVRHFGGSWKLLCTCTFVKMTCHVHKNISDSAHSHTSLCIFTLFQHIDGTCTCTGEHDVGHRWLRRFAAVNHIGPNRNRNAIKYSSNVAFACAWLLAVWAVLPEYINFCTQSQRRDRLFTGLFQASKWTGTHLVCNWMKRYNVNSRGFNTYWFVSSMHFSTGQLAMNSSWYLMLLSLARHKSNKCYR